MKEVFVWICSRIGDPVDEPQITSVQIRTQRGVRARDVEPVIREILARQFGEMERFCADLTEGLFSLY